MISVRILNLESNEDANNVVEFLEDEFRIDRKFAALTVRTAAPGALHNCHQDGEFLMDKLTKAVSNYLTHDDYVIFVADPEQRSPLMDHIRRIVKASDFSDNVFFAPEVRGAEFSASVEWRDIVSRFHVEIQKRREAFDEKWMEWQKNLTRFQEVFAGTPEGEVLQNFEKVLVEVRRERTMAHAEAQLRKIAKARGLEWDAMTDLEREYLVDDLVHEDRECSR